MDKKTTPPKGFIWLKTNDRRGGSIRVAVKKKRPPKPKIQAKSLTTEGKVILSLPLIAVTEANTCEYWLESHKRHQKQKQVVASILNPVRDKISLPCQIKFTRLAPRSLDKTDNLPMSMKHIIDATCAIVTGDFRPGRADSDPRLTLSCDQRKNSEYGVEVEFTF